MLSWEDCTSRSIRLSIQNLGNLLRFCIDSHTYRVQDEHMTTTAAQRTDSLTVGQTIILEVIGLPQMTKVLADVRSEAGWTHLAFTDGTALTRRSHTLTTVAADPKGL